MNKSTAAPLNTPSDHDASPRRMGKGGAASLIQAARIGLRHMRAELAMLLDSSCLHSKLDSKPLRETLDAEARPIVAKLERDIATVAAAIKGAA